jgi:hypothetical protein
MRKFILLALALLGSTAAHASSPADLICQVRDTGGNLDIYTFNGNSHNVDGTFGGTVVETGFEKNGKTTMYDAGLRPIWIYSSAGEFVNIASREAPGWVLTWGNSTAVNGVIKGPAILTYRGRLVGKGDCMRLVEATQTTAGNIGDLGN